ncbi:MAG TPA: phage integrase N-terminal SAM-like domain-containing protein [Gammaproteobacteria bacterium]|nr:phage integrase N-terminal SAM-like domain-containing protein [Gammaproteobacteria bacterium]
MAGSSKSMCSGAGTDCGRARHEPELVLPMSPERTGVKWWARQDSNLGPRDYDSARVCRSWSSRRRHGRRRDYSIRTEQTYLQWIRCFFAFAGRRDPRVLGAAEVKGFLEHLAVYSPEAVPYREFTDGRYAETPFSYPSDIPLEAVRELATIVAEQTEARISRIERESGGDGGGSGLDGTRAIHTMYV